MKDKMTNGDRICINMVHIFLILLGLSHYYSQNILNTLIVILILGVMVISSTDIKLILLFLILPFFNLLSVKIGSNSFFYIFLIYVLISVLKKNKWRVKKKKIIVIMCGVVLTVFWQNPMIQIKWVIIFSSLYLLLDDEMMEKNMPLIMMNFISFSIVLGAKGKTKILMMVFVRVDFYNINGKPYFGELTFTPRNGLKYDMSPEIDLKFGNMTDISNI